MPEPLDHPGYPGQCCDTSPCTCQPQPLTDRIAEAARTVRLRLGPNSRAIVKAGGTIPLSGGEADDVAAAVMAVVEPELAALRRDLSVEQEMLTEVTAMCTATEREAATLRAENARLRSAWHSARVRANAYGEGIIRHCNDRDWLLGQVRHLESALYAATNPAPAVPSAD